MTILLKFRNLFVILINIYVLSQELIAWRGDGFIGWKKSENEVDGNFMRITYKVVIIEKCS